MQRFASIAAGGAVLAGILMSNLPRLD